MGVVAHLWISLVFPLCGLVRDCFWSVHPWSGFRARSGLGQSGLGLGFGSDSVRSFSAASSLLAPGVGTPWGEGLQPKE